MTRQMFVLWIEHMKITGRARTIAEAGRLLGVSAATMTDWRRRGTYSRLTDLACAATVYGIAPYGEIERPGEILDEEAA